MLTGILGRPLVNFVNKGGLRTTIIRKFRDYQFKPPDLLWSRGWFAHCDHYGDGSFLYPAYPTRYMVRSLKQLRGKSGLIWLRLGSYPVNKNWGADRLGDVATFARDVVSHLGGPTVLVTSDGDMSVPAHLPPGVAEEILEDQHVAAWFTQHYDGTINHPKLFPIPVGLGLHAGSIGRITGVHGQARRFQLARSASLSPSKRIMKIWSDVHFRIHPAHNGNPRGPLREAINRGDLKDFVDTPEKRLSQTEIWRRYGRYAFVISLPGHGWESYRTWEALALGAVVITIHSPLDNILKPYRVVFLEESNTRYWNQLRDPQWIKTAWERAMNKPIVNLSWEPWVTMVRSKLER